jgi:hypothetical protein
VHYLRDYSRVHHDILRNGISIDLHGKRTTYHISRGIS